MSDRRSRSRRSSSRRSRSRSISTRSKSRSHSKTRRRSKSRSQSKSRKPSNSRSRHSKSRERKQTSRSRSHSRSSRSRSKSKSRSRSKSREHKRPPEIVGIVIPKIPTQEELVARRAKGRRSLFIKPIRDDIRELPSGEQYSRRLNVIERLQKDENSFVVDYDTASWDDVRDVLDGAKREELIEWLEGLLNYKKGLLPDDDNDTLYADDDDDVNSTIREEIEDIKSFVLSAQKQSIPRRDIITSIIHWMQQLNNLDIAPKSYVLTSFPEFPTLY